LKGFGRFGVQIGSMRFKKVLKGSRGFYEVQKGFGGLGFGVGFLNFEFVYCFDTNKKERP
jgi:hypothetical protein